MAWLIDFVVLFVIGAIIGVLMAMGSDANALSEEDIGATDLLGLLVSILYHTIGVGVWSTTVGKRLLGVYVVRTDGSKVGPGRALARWFAYIPSWLLLGTGFIMIGVSEDKRGLHDHICDTVVVRR